MSVFEQVDEALRRGLRPLFVQVVDRSHMHNVPEGAESHFKVTVVSSEFEGLSRVNRHRRVYELLRDQLEGPVHALEIHAYTESEWEALDAVPESPKCLGGSKQDKG